MTNGEKYTTFEERNQAFSDYCQKRDSMGICRHCDIQRCVLNWLDIDVAEHPIKHCPYCYGTCECREELNHKFRVVCLRPECWYSSSLKGCYSDAIDAHNWISEIIDERRNHD